jgi:serine/threonine protein kinase
MSPEQARGEELDVRTDLFSFGAVLYEMATGRMAFHGNTTAVIHDAILNRAPIPVTHVNPELPPKLAEIIGKALEKNHQLRYQRAADIRTDLHRLKRELESRRTAAAISETEQKPTKSVAFRWARIAGTAVDYGSGPMVRDPHTVKYRRTRLFVLTLGYSRKSVRLLAWRSSVRIWAELQPTWRSPIQVG